MSSALSALSLSLVLASALLPGTAGCSTETKFTGVEPNTGTFSGGEEIVLQGQNFPRGGVTVRFGYKEAKPVVFESTSRIKVYTPSGDKNVNSDITITFDDGRAFVLKNGFRYVDTTQQKQTMDKFFDKVKK
jgi:hypothetical protein